MGKSDDYTVWVDINSGIMDNTGNYFKDSSWVIPSRVMLVVVARIKDDVGREILNLFLGMMNWKLLATNRWLVENNGVEYRAEDIILRLVDR